MLGAAAVMAVVALHLLARRRPREVPLPTARFVPEYATESSAITARPSDIMLMALRSLAVLAIAAALAAPVLRGNPRPIARVVLADVSRAVRSAGDVRYSASAYLASGDVLIAFDSSARVDSLGGLTVARLSGSLSAALVAAMRETDKLRGRADSVELVIVSPLAREEIDAATLAIRARWPGRARIARIASAAVVPALAAVEFRGAPDDPLRATLALRGRSAPALVRIVRDALTSADTVWSSAGPRVLVHWPAAASAAGDAHGAVVAGDDVFVADFARVERLTGGRVIARWEDGSAAATERAIGAGCMRRVRVPIAARGDVALGESARRLLGAMLAPCGGTPELSPASDSVVGALRGNGALFPLAPQEADTRLPTLWLIAVALVCLALEMLARRSGMP